MEHGPLPPHERTWRHPSELAAEEQAVLRGETSPSVSRAVALTTGTLGLFAIAVLVLAVTPGNHAQPIAVSATTAPATISTSADEPDRNADASIASARRVPSASLAQMAAVRALATPIGEGRYALVSQASVGEGLASRLDVTLPSGRVTVGEVVERSGDTVLIVLSETEPGHDVAEHRPHDREVVTVMAEPPVTIAYADVSTLEVAEGTAVVDSDGNLVGLCTKSGHGRRVRLIAVDDEMTTPDEMAGAIDENTTAGDDHVDEADEVAATPTPATEPATDEESSDHTSMTTDTSGESDDSSRSPMTSASSATSSTSTTDDD